MSARIPAAFLHVNRLGRPVHYYPARSQRTWLPVVLGVTLGAGAALLAIYGVYTAWERWFQYGPAVVPRTVIPPLLLAGLMGAVGLIAVGIALWPRGRGVMVYQDGITVVDGQNLISRRWDEIQQITRQEARFSFLGIILGQQKWYELKDDQGNSIKLDKTTQGAPAVAWLMREKVYPRLLEEAAQKFNRDQTLVFGTLRVNRKLGVWTGKQWADWTNVQRVSVERGKVKIVTMVNKRRREFKNAAGKIPNLEIFLALAADRAPVKVGGAQQGPANNRPGR